MKKKGGREGGREGEREGGREGEGSSVRHLAYTAISALPVTGSLRHPVGLPTLLLTIPAKPATHTGH